MVLFYSSFGHSMENKKVPSKEEFAKAVVVVDNDYTLGLPHGLPSYPQDGEKKNAQSLKIDAPSEKRKRFELTCP